MAHSLATPAQSLDQLCIDTVRALSMDAVQRANSGHPGTPMALAPLIWLLFTRHLRHNPANPAWNDRDRFVLSAGHASMLLYSALYLSGYDLSLDDIRQFRQWESATPSGSRSRRRTCGQCSTRVGTGRWTTTRGSSPATAT